MDKQFTVSNGQRSRLGIVLEKITAAFSHSEVGVDPEFALSALQGLSEAVHIEVPVKPKRKSKKIRVAVVTDTVMRKLLIDGLISHRIGLKSDPVTECSAVVYELTDLSLGITFIGSMTALCIPVIVFDRTPSIERATAVMKQQAFEYFQTPVHIEQIAQAIYAAAKR